MSLPTQFILTVQCPDRTGIVAAAAGFLADRDLTIVEADHFHDHLQGQFFMRTAFSAVNGIIAPSIKELEAGFAPIARRYAMKWAFYDTSVKPKVVIAVSKFSHCLSDLLQRWKSNWLRADIVAVVSNHEDLAEMVEWYGLPFVYRPVSKENKAEAERAFLDTMNQYGADLFVLARYMQVLSLEMVQALEGRCINIHHSFLPGFKGAKPYHQAHERGVKMIGATAHYVTIELDEGPIIEQDVQRVSHSDTPEDLIEIGRDVECTTLARAVRWHVERRILLAGSRTVVFR